MNYTAEDEIMIERRWTPLVESWSKTTIYKKEEG